MFKKLGAFLRPHKATLFVFAALILLMPVPYVTFEPERTNYLPGEEQHWSMKTKRYESPLNEYLLHTNGNFDVFTGILARDYFGNYIGIILLASYYVIACGAGSLIRRAQRAASAQKM